MSTIVWDGQAVPVVSRTRTPAGAVVVIRTGVPRGRAEVMQVLRYLGGARYLAQVRFLDDPDHEYEREVTIDK